MAKGLIALLSAPKGDKGPKEKEEKAEGGDAAAAEDGAIDAYHAAIGVPEEKLEGAREALKEALAACREAY